jgi:tungstate transport system ATP-binding protein
MHGGFSILPLRAEGLTYAVRGKTLLDDVAFEIGRGRTVIMGPNGAGKTLTLRLCHGLIAPSFGMIRWAGPVQANGRQRHAMLFQRPVLLRRSVFGNLTYALSLAGLPRPERKRKAQEALDRFGLADLASRPARLLSGGEQQRLALARAWTLSPEVLFLDEPTAALDPAATRIIEEMVRALEADGISVVMTTHDLGQARRLAEVVLFLHNGRLLEQALADEFFSKPRTEAARAFIKG